MARFTTTLMIALVLCSTLTYASRPVPATVPAKSQAEGGHGAEQGDVAVAEESCDGVEEEECLMRRTLAAHTDYIYTQKHKP